MRTTKRNPYVLSVADRAAQACFPILQRAGGSPWSRKLNLTISHKHRFIWFRVAKNGTRTLLKSLVANGVELDVVEAFQCRYPIRRYRDYYKFAVVRNPWDRLVSCWHNKILEKNGFRLSDPLYERLHDFKAFVHYVAAQNIKSCNIHYRAQTELIDLIEVDTLIRLESYEEGLVSVAKTIGIERFEIRSTNRTSTRRNYDNYYTSETRDIVARIYKEDIQNFKYQF